MNNQHLHHNLSFIDLKSESPQSHTSLSKPKEMAYEFRQNDLFTTDGLRTYLRVSQMRETLQRKSQDQNLFVLGSISMHGIRAAYLSRKSQSYRSKPASDTRQTLPHGHTGQSISQYALQRQYGSRLAHIRRLCSSANSRSKETLRQPQFRAGVGTNSLCIGCHHNRFMSFSFSLGSISKTKRRLENAYSFGLARQHSQRSYYYSRKSPRRQHPRLSYHRSRFDLRYGPCLSGLCASLQYPSVLGIFRHPCQKQFSVQTPLLKSRRQTYRDTMRSGYYPQELLCQKKLSRKTTSHSILRRAEKQTVRVPDKQFQPFCTDDRTTLSIPLADRTILQMDKAASANKEVLRYLRECSENANMDSDLCLRARCHRKEATETGAEPLHNSTDFECLTFRENPHFAGSFGDQTQKSREDQTYTTEFLRLTLGQ